MKAHRNSIECLVHGAMEKAQLTKNDVVRRMGYSNLNKGVRRLDHFLKGDMTDKTFVKKLTEALNASPEEMQSAIDSDQLRAKQRAEELARKDFKPYIYLQTTATRPSQICIYALTGGTRTHKMISVPEDLPSESWSKQVKTVRALIIEHIQKNEGVVPFFGKASGYLYCPLYDSSYEFTVQGETDEVDRGHFWLPEASVRVK